MAGRIEVRVPDIGDFTDVPVIEVLVSPGDSVETEQSLITLESDKATMEVPSPAAGRVAEVAVSLDDKVSEGDLVVVLEGETDAEDSPAAEPDEQGEPAAEPDEQDEPTAEPDEQDEPTAEPEEKDEPAKGESRGKPGPTVEPAEIAEPERPPPMASGELDAGERRSPPVPLDAASTLPGKVPYASPAIRMFARELGVDLARVTGSGRKGRILREDVAGFVKSVMSGKETAPAIPGFQVAPPPKVDFSSFGETERQELSRIRKIGAKNLHRNWVTIPHVTNNDKADITELEAFRQAHKASAKEQGFNLTPLAFLMKAVVAALQEYPRFNASLDADGEHLVLKRYYNIGIAVDTPDGLVVPVIRECDAKGVMDLAGELAEVSQRARDNKLTMEDWQGACFTISSLGGIGGTSFSPIINLPEVAILGVSRSVHEPVWDGDAFQPRLMLPLSLSYDHRVIDGAEAARFLRFLAAYLENQDNLVL